MRRWKFIGGDAIRVFLDLIMPKKLKVVWENVFCVFLGKPRGIEFKCIPTAVSLEIRLLRNINACTLTLCQTALLT